MVRMTAPSEALLALLRPFTPSKPAPRNTPLEVRLASKIDYQGDDACWEWRGAGPCGYGHLPIDHRATYVHRVVYELLVGPIPEGLEIDHLCRNRGCCNPRHLEAVTHKENVRRGLVAARRVPKTHCRRGHPYDAANTYIRHDGSRFCRACARYRARQRVA